MKFQNNLRFLIVLSFAIAFFGCSKDSTVPPRSPIVAEEPKFGAVSGVITDARTGNPIPGAVVSLFNQTVETGVDGRYAFTQIAYSDALNLTVKATDYEPQTQTFALKVDRLFLDIALMSLTNPEAEIQQFFDTLSALVESRNMNNLKALQAHFSEAYLAADDPVTRFGLATGVIPANFEKVIPSITALFEKYNRIKFEFHDLQMNVIHTRKASTRLKLDVLTEKGPRPDRNNVTIECQIDLRKEESGWKATFWQLFKVDVHLN